MQVSRGLTRYIPTVGPAELKEYSPTDEVWLGYAQLYEQTAGRGFGHLTIVPAHTRSRKKYKRMGRPGRMMGQPGCSANADCEGVTQRTSIPHLCIDGQCMQIRGAHRGVRQGI